MIKEINADLTKIANGTVQQKFVSELKKVLINLTDMNTDLNKERKITIELGFLLDGIDGSTVKTTVNVKSKLIPQSETGTKFILHQDQNGDVLVDELLSGAKGQTYMDKDGKLRDDSGRIVDDDDLPKNER